MARKAPSRRAAGAPTPAGGLFGRIFNVNVSRDTERDWTFDHASAAGLVSTANVPAQRDLRERWWKAADQGGTGACVGFATADSVLRWHFVATNRLARNEPLSVRFVWMSAKETDEFTNAPTTFVETAGTSLKAALDVTRKYGVVKDAVLPFGSGALYQGEERDLYVLASQYKINGYINLGQDPRKWRAWLGARGPILTRLDVDAAFNNAATGNAQLATYVRPSRPAGHAVALVGYDANSFIVRNSWSERWGDDGFAYASNAYAASAFTEAYGVMVA